MTSIVVRRLCISAVKFRSFSCATVRCYFSTCTFKYTSNSLVPPTTLSNLHTPIGYHFCGTVRLNSSSSEQSELKEEGKDNESKKKKSVFKRFKEMYRDYWYVLVPVHCVTSAAWFGGFYYLASSGVDIPALLDSLNVSEKFVNSMRNSSMGYVAIAYGLYKLATPARYIVTLGGTTVSIQYLKKWGFIKPIPSKERLKEIYEETREGMKEKKENIMESVKDLKDAVKETREGIKEKKDNLVSSVKMSKGSIKKSEIVHKENSKS